MFAPLTTLWHTFAVFVTNFTLDQNWLTLFIKPSEAILFTRKDLSLTFSVWENVKISPEAFKVRQECLFASIALLFLSPYLFSDLTVWWKSTKRLHRPIVTCLRKLSTDWHRNLKRGSFHLGARMPLLYLIWFIEVNAHVQRLFRFLCRFSNCLWKNERVRPHLWKKREPVNSIASKTRGLETTPAPQRNRAECSIMYHAAP